MNNIIKLNIVEINNVAGGAKKKKKRHKGSSPNQIEPQGYFNWQHNLIKNIFPIPLFVAGLFLIGIGLNDKGEIVANPINSLFLSAGIIAEVVAAGLWFDLAHNSKNSMSPKH